MTNIPHRDIDKNNTTEGSMSYIFDQIRDAFALAPTTRREIDNGFESATGAKVYIDGWSPKYRIIIPGYYGNRPTDKFHNYLLSNWQKYINGHENKVEMIEFLRTMLKETWHTTT